MKKFLNAIRHLAKFLLLAVVVLALIYLAPYLYNRFFYPGSTQWISERFSEKLEEKSELVVYEVTLAGKETISTTAWAIGPVQVVQIPYEYTLSFAVNLSHSRVEALGNNTIEVRLPPPRALFSYSKLMVDEGNVKKYDWLYPLTPERYAGMKEEIERKLYDECAANPDYLESAWKSTEKRIETDFHDLAEQMDQVTAISIVVLMEEPASTQSSPEEDS